MTFEEALADALAAREEFIARIEKVAEDMEGEFQAKFSNGYTFIFSFKPMDAKAVVAAAHRRFDPNRFD